LVRCSNSDFTEVQYNGSAISKQETGRADFFDDGATMLPDKEAGCAGYRGAAVVRRTPVVAACRMVWVNGVRVRRCV
jgi:hypothetical protein